MDNTTSTNQNTNSTIPSSTPSSVTPPMEDITPPVPEQSSTPPPPPITPIEERNNQNTQDGNTKKGFGMLIGLLLVLIIIFLGLMFIFVIRQPSDPVEPDQQVPIVETMPSPTVVVSPTPDLTEENVNSIDIGSPEADLSPVQQELNTLE